VLRHVDGRRSDSAIDRQRPSGRDDRGAVGSTKPRHEGSAHAEFSKRIERRPRGLPRRFQKLALNQPAARAPTTSATPYGITRSLAATTECRGTSRLAGFFRTVLTSRIMVAAASLLVRRQTSKAS